MKVVILYGECVSILVFMDVLVVLTKFLTKILTRFRFNPCFYGCLSGTTVFSRIESYTDLTVSILVFMDVLVVQSACCVVYVFVSEVSILVFMDVLVVQQPALVADLCTVDGFNPCFYGCLSGTCHIYIFIFRV